MASSDSVRESLVKFSYRLYDKVVNSQKGCLENTFLSPLSLYTSLSMMMVGSDGTTKQELLEALQMPQSFGAHDGHYQMGNTLMEYFKPTEGVKVNIANRFFTDNRIKVKQEYQEKLNKCFNGVVESIAISANPEQARTHINSWVQQQTINKITDLIPSGSINSDTLAVLANALYFKGIWESQFKKEKTNIDVFHKLDGSEVKVPFMFQNCECKTACPVLSASKMIRIPFSGSNWEMMILLPNAKNGLTQLLQDISQPGQLESVLKEEGFENRQDLHLPKFKLSGRSANVIQLLSQLGMNSAFSSSADFSGIANDKLSISEIHHKAVLEVDEEGATAAAASAIAMNRCRPPPPIRIDHPFFLALVYGGNIPVFMGHVVEPEWA